MSQRQFVHVLEGRVSHLVGMISAVLMAAGMAAGQAATPPAATKPAQDASAPIIHVASVEHDFGDVWTGTEVQYTFEISNRGKSTLEIKAVRPQCGCTVAGEYPRTIEPGQSGKFPFSMRTTGFRGRASKGITIDSNDPVTPNLALSLRGNFKTRVDLSPGAAVFGPVIGDRVASRVVKITNNTETALTLKLQPLQTDRFKCELVQTQPGKEFELRVSTVAPHKSGEVNLNAVLETNLPEEKTVNVFISARFPGRLDLYPAQVSVSRPGQPIFFWMSNYGASLVKLKEAATDDPAIKVKYDTVSAGKNYRIHVTIPPGTTLPPQGRVLTLKTDDPQIPELTAKLVPQAPPAPPAAQQTAQRPIDRAVGQPVPAFSVTTFDGKPLTQDDLKGKITVLNFISPTCGWCKKQLPEVEPIRQAYQDKGIRFINIINPNPSRTHEYSKDEAKQVFEPLNVKLEMALDTDMKLGGAIGATGYPTMVLVGKDAKVAAVNVGYNTVSNLKPQLEALLAGKPVPAPPPPPPPVTQRPIDRAIGQPVPAFSMTTFEDKPFTQDNLKDKITVLNFISPACPWCKKQLPEVEPIRQAYQDKGVRFINVVNANPSHTHEFSKDEINQVLNSLNAKLEVAVDADMKLGGAIGATAYPTMVLVGKDAKVAAVNVGYNTVSNLKPQLEALLAGKPIPAASQPAVSQARPIDSTVGKPVPAFSVTTFDNKPLNQDSLKDKVTVLNFVSPTCGWCKKQIPALEPIRTAYKDKGVRFINIWNSNPSRSHEYTRDEINQIAVSLNTGMELALDEGMKAGSAFLATSYPTMVVVGKDARVAAVNVGANKADLLSGQLDALLAGKPVATRPAAEVR